MSISKTDLKFISQSRAAGAESHDPTRKVGAVIVGNGGQPLATGTNRPPDALHLSLSDSLGAIEKDKNWKYFMLEHAERNAISKAHDLGHEIKGTTIYGTLFPCAACARAIAEAGIKRAVFPAPDQNNPRNEKWTDDFNYAEQIFKLANIRLDFYVEEKNEASGQNSQEGSDSTPVLLHPVP